MAVQIKPKTKIDTNVKTGLDPEAQLKELANLAHPLAVKEAKLKAELKKLSLELAKIQDQVSATVAEMGLAPSDTYQAYGVKGSIKVGKETEAREIKDKEAAIAMLDAVEDGLAYELANFKLGDLDKYLTPQQLEQVVEKAYTGKRIIKFA